MAEEYKYDDGAVLEGATRQVRLGDRTYTLHEPPRGLARKLRRHYANIQDRYNQAVQSDDTQLMLDVTDELLDQVYQFNVEIAEDEEYIEDHATERQILAAWKAGWELINDPLVSTVRQAAEQSKPNRKARRAKNGTGTKTAGSTND